ncbi:hypothetical protein B0H11DRAFT_1925619 [Mycena galericulata]|nr:hypothetical protein B0H11DRAFT_1925619 [Mycena galericulata]
MSGMPDGRISGTHVMVGGRVRHIVSDVGNQCRPIEIQWKPLSPDALESTDQRWIPVRSPMATVTQWGHRWPPVNFPVLGILLLPALQGDTPESRWARYVASSVHCVTVIDCINPANCCNVGLEKKETRESYGRHSLSAGQNLRIH